MHWPRISVTATRFGPSHTGPSGNSSPVATTVGFMPAVWHGLAEKKTPPDLAARGRRRREGGGVSVRIGEERHVEVDRDPVRPQPLLERRAGIREEPEPRVDAHLRLARIEDELEELRYRGDR